MNPEPGKPLDYRRPSSPDEAASDRQPFSPTALVLVFYVPMALSLLAVAIAVELVAQRPLPRWVWPMIGLVFLVPPTIVAIAFLRRRNADRR